MTRRNGYEELHTNKVQTLNNDHTIAKKKKNDNRRAELTVLKRRVFSFLAIAVVIIVGLVSANMALKERLAEKEAYKLEVSEQLQAVTETQDMLKLQITKLEDDEYIAKLARKEYFLSEDGEIIFTIPKESATNVKEPKEE
ncbi:MAG: septum formation initiator family protein [Solibacillus sp.]